MFTPGKLHQLKYGSSYGEWFGGGGFTDGAPLYRGGPAWFEAAGAWEFLRPQLLREWLTLTPNSSGHGGPGSRPAAWWWFDSPGLRRRIDGRGPHPFDNRARDAWFDRTSYLRSQKRRTFYGRPSAFARGDGFDDFECVFESEREYIERLDLWLPGERELP